MYKLMYIIQIVICENSLQWYNNKLGQMFLCHRSKKNEGFITQILGSSLFIPERDVKIVTSVKVHGKPYSAYPQIEALDEPYSLHGTKQLESMLEVKKMPIYTHEDQKSNLKQISAS